MPIEWGPFGPLRPPPGASPLEGRDRATIIWPPVVTIMGWSEDRVAVIRRRYVDEAAIVVAVSQRIAAGMWYAM